MKLEYNQLIDMSKKSKIIYIFCKWVLHCASKGIYKEARQQEKISMKT
jgi:hypothetical protein